MMAHKLPSKRKNVANCSFHFATVGALRMTEAEHCLCEVTADIPADVRERLDTAEELGDSDRETIVQIARKSLARFQPKPETKAKPEVQRNGKPEPKAEPEGKL